MYVLTESICKNALNCVNMTMVIRNHNGISRFVQFLEFPKRIENLTIVVYVGCESEEDDSVQWNKRGIMTNVVRDVRDLNNLLLI
jgi:hypothetical protein